MKDFEGSIEFNNVLYSSRVKIFSTGSGLHFRPADRPTFLERSIGIWPFPSVALVLSAEKMQSGFFYSIEGTEIGSCSEGPLGHPADREYRIWPLLKFTISAKYSSSMLTLKLSGSTDKGFEVEQGIPNNKHNNALKSMTFELCINIPKDYISDALKLPANDARSLYEKMESFV